MSKILNPLQIVASALAMRPAHTEPVATDSDEPGDRRVPKRLPRRVRQRLRNA